MGAHYRNIYFLLFALSGFSGLMYESIWTHYLKLFLGHSAYAQTLVLAIFMGGMAIGSWVCSRYSLIWKNLLLGFAITEGIIGICALFFHNAFVCTTNLSYAFILPRLGNPAVVSVLKWSISALMILPQSVMLGMTFPLMSAGILRLFPDKPGRSIALLYFTNSLGAAIGVLASGFLLIRWTGLPGTIRTAGLINIALALTVWFLIRKSLPGEKYFQGGQVAASRGKESRWYWYFLLASLVTGTASFIYEIGWIRMLSLVLGSSTHAFELMLSAFISGLAFGGLWIQRRIDHVAHPVRYLAQVQVIMGLLALSTLLLYGNAFEVMKWILESLNRTDTGYVYFNLFSNAIALGIMLPTSFCAGMTLPLLTFVLIREGHGEKSIGAVYAANTVGAILGVFFSVHFGMPLLGLKGLIAFGASLDIALGLALYWHVAADFGNYRKPVAVTSIGICAVAGILLFVHLDPYKMASGVYRSGEILSRDQYKVLYHKDGKTATVSLTLDRNGALGIRTNGKSDAAIMMEQGREPNIDEPTMILAAAIPMALKPQTRTAAVIGLGSGLTTQTLLGNPLIQEVDTVEIEEEMVEAAKRFRPRVERVYADPRSTIYIDDAKTFFSTYNRKYDIIVSEPSNPWVSGVAGLFSVEFYRLIRNHLNENGLLVQWVQVYEINVELVASVVKALSANFPDFSVYAATDSNILIVAGKSGPTPELDPDVLKIPEIGAALKRIRIEGMQDIAIRKIGTKKFLGRFVGSFPILANSDYFPVLDQNAAQARFMGDTAMELIHFPHVPLPTLEILNGQVPPWKVTSVTYSPFLHKSQVASMAMALRDYFLVGRFDPKYADIPEDIRQKAARLRELFFECGSSTNEFERLESLFDISVNMAPSLSPYEMEAIWKILESGPCATKLTTQEKQWVVLFKAVGKRDAIGMVHAARMLLETGKGLPMGALRYVVASGMLGALALGDTAESYRFWSANKSAMFGDNPPDLLFRLLAAESTVQ